MNNIKPKLRKLGMVGYGYLGLIPSNEKDTIMRMVAKLRNRTYIKRMINYKLKYE